jgi:hypothetical protein
MVLIKIKIYIRIWIQNIKENSNDVVHHLEYNAERSHLIIPEYGRHLQKLIKQPKLKMI